MRDAVPDFVGFFETNHRSLGKLAYLLTADSTAADDLTGDTFLAAWHQWERIREVDEPVAYVRRMMANIAAGRVRSAVRERGRLARLWSADSFNGPDPAVTVSVQAALAALPPRRRACVVLRHAFDLSEQDVATMMGISVGTVKSQTAKAVKQLAGALAGPSGEGRW